jgi:hypothetical protein
LARAALERAFERDEEADGVAREVDETDEVVEREAEVVAAEEVVEREANKEEAGEEDAGEEEAGEEEAGEEDAGEEEAGEDWPTVRSKHS